MTASTSASSTSATTRLAATLAATPGADDWQYTGRRDDEVQLYLIGDQVETRRQVTNQRTVVALFNDHPPAGGEVGALARGSTTLTLSGDELADGARLAARLRDGVAVARLTDNPPFALPAPDEATGRFPDARIYDEALAANLPGALDTLRADLERAVAAEPGVRLSSAELYATHNSIDFRNSRGLAGAYDATTASLDLALLASAGDREAEFHAALTRRRMDDLQVARTVGVYATYARDLLRAIPTPTHSGAVILSGDALSTASSPGFGGFGGFFNPLVFQLSGQAAFQGLARCAPGEFITGDTPRDDRLTVYSDGLRAWGVHSVPFDENGVPATNMLLVEDGVLRRRWNDIRTAAWLGENPPTGRFAGMTIAPGRWRVEDLRSVSEGPVCEIVAFSVMLPDQITGDFAAEIRLGYYHDADGVRPITGGSVSGNLFAALADARFSSNVFSDGIYYGPTSIRFGALTISGV